MKYAIIGTGAVGSYYGGNWLMQVMMFTSCFIVIMNMSTCMACR